jgi:Porin subfamily
MRKLVLTIILAGWPALALAEQPSRYTSGKANSVGKQFKLKGAVRENPCAEYGAGFVKLEGSDTCMKIGGYVSSGASAHMGAR